MSRSSLLLSLIVVLGGPPAHAQEFDSTPLVLRGSDFLAPEIRKGDHHEVDERVENDGFLNTYRISSDFGRFEAYGNLELALRVQEIGALAELDELSKSAVFAEAAKESALGSVKAIEKFADQPVETVKGIPGGAKRMFRATKRRAGELKEDVDDELEERREEKAAQDGEGAEGGEEGDEGKSAEEVADDAVDAGAYLVKRYFGVSDAERRWAQKLGVDPYTSNEVLRKQIKEFARVDSAGRFSVRLLPIPSIPGASLIGTINKVVWSKNPYELQDYNRERLASMGAEPELIDAFFEVPWLSPSAQTIFISALIGLEAESRLLALDNVLELESVDQGRFLLQAAQMLAWLDRKVSPIARLLPGERTLVGLTADQRVVVPLPVDYLSWTREVAELAQRKTAELAASGGRRIELGLAWRATDLVRERIEALGGQVRTDLADEMRDNPLSEPEE